jgi:NAD(P)-dependent dehydrogenase (short-subunit alcohol dehydrogenase family)
MMQTTAPRRRHALITGGATGIGAAIAHRMAADGIAVTLLGRRTSVLAAMATKLPGAAFVTADVTDRAQVDAAFAAARAVHGPIDILVCNAGAAESGRFEKQGFDVWRRLMAVNLDALHHCGQSALPDLRASTAGRMVVIASTAGLKGYAYSVAYSAAKHGAIGLVRGLALELAATSVTVNAVCPGFADTEIVAEAVAKLVEKTGRTAEQARSDLAKFNPQGRLIDPDEVADAVAWLCAASSRSITGQAIAVAGGEVM